MNSNSSGCVFCGASPVTLEHVFSRKWLESLMPDTTSLTTHVIRDGHEPKTFVQRPKNPANIWRGGAAINCACKKCNETWMQAMDEGVKPVITPLALGQRGTVKAEGIRRLGIWATKVALVLDSARTPPVVEPDIKHAFRKKPWPLEASGIWVGAMNPTDDSVRTYTVDLGPPPGAEDGKGFVATFRVIHLVVQVLWSPHLDLRRGDDFTKLLEPLWPRDKEPLPWPPPESSFLTSEDEFQKLATSFRGRRV